MRSIRFSEPSKRQRSGGLDSGFQPLGVRPRGVKTGMNRIAEPFGSLTWSLLSGMALMGGATVGGCVLSARVKKVVVVAVDAIEFCFVPCKGPLCVRT